MITALFLIYVMKDHLKYFDVKRGDKRNLEFLRSFLLLLFSFYFQLTLCFHYKYRLLLLNTRGRFLIFEIFLPPPDLIWTFVNFFKAILRFSTQKSRKNRGLRGSKGQKVVFGGIFSETGH